jgi:hypothetical protein
MSEAEELRVSEMIDQIPTYSEALGCVDCGKLFRCGAQCPYCESRSIENIAGLLNGAISRTNPAPLTNL